MPELGRYLSRQLPSETGTTHPLMGVVNLTVNQAGHSHSKLVMA